VQVPQSDLQSAAPSPVAHFLFLPLFFSAKRI
jgi:hypothetical protein